MSYMTAKQKILQKVYPAFIKLTRFLNIQNKVIQNKENIQPVVPPDNLSIRMNSGKEISIGSLKGKKLMIVNTASNCGYTAQYEGLQKLYEQFQDRLEIIGFPSNDFKEQEKGTDEEIASFCKVNYGVTFPLAKKSSVLKGMGQEELYKWLTSREQNGWNEQEPTWNFSKYLIDEQGVLTHYFDPSVLPEDEELVKAIGIDKPMLS